MNKTLENNGIDYDVIHKLPIKTLLGKDDKPLLEQWEKTVIVLWLAGSYLIFHIGLICLFN